MDDTWEEATATTTVESQPHKRTNLEEQNKKLDDPEMNADSLEGDVRMESQDCVHTEEHGFQGKQEHESETQTDPRQNDEANNNNDDDHHQQQQPLPKVEAVAWEKSNDTSSMMLVQDAQALTTWKDELDRRQRMQTHDREWKEWEEQEQQQQYTILTRIGKPCCPFSSTNHHEIAKPVQKDKP